ncbi:MAG: hypothetical protein AB8H12_04995 [Lewinella sp.]
MGRFFFENGSGALRGAGLLRRFALVTMMLLGTCLTMSAQSTNETISSGAFIINMGVTPQTRNNALRPYGMIYDLIENYQVPVKWVINQSKAKDGTDFTFNGVNYRGGPFIIPAGFRTPVVNGRISFWQGQGVIGTTTTSPITVPVFATLQFAPNWTLDRENGDIAEDFFSNASIPSSSYGDKPPSQLGPCDDIFAMPHADPEWSTHERLLSWNADNFGAIWYGCHAGSALENMFNPANPSQQTNFLAEKTGTANGGGPYANPANTLILWDDHDDASFPLAYDYASDPVMQFMGTIDAATDNGSEQVYIPVNPGWRTTTRAGIYDPDNNERVSSALRHRAAVTAWGRGFGDPNRGWVLMQGAHDINKKNDPSNIAAQRIFFNLGFRALIGKVAIPSVSALTPGATIAPGEPIALSVTIPPPATPANFTVNWTSSCGGTFSPSSTSFNPTFTPPGGSGSYTCVISATITDPCGRTSFSTTAVNVACALQISTSIAQPCGGGNSGVIDYSVTGGTSPTYSWTRSGGGTGSGSGTSISGLTAGTYTVTVTTSNGCTSTFTRTLNASPNINLTATASPVACFGQSTGSISLNVSGGTPGFTYAWDDGPTTQNRSSLNAGIYTVIVTDANSCTATTSATVTQPNAALAATPTATNVACFGEATGAVALAVTGGTTPYTFLWSNGLTVQNPMGLTPGTYAVTVTDANNCNTTATNIMISQPAMALSLSTTQTNSNCGSGSGSVTVTATGGAGPYTYDWSDTPIGDGSPTITGLSSGTYAVTVTDANSCTALISATVTESTPIILSFAPTNPTCPPGAAPPVNSDGEVNLTVAGGTMPYTYNWTTGDGSGLNPTVEDQTGLTAGTYSVTVTGANFCTASGSVTLVFENQVPVTPGGINNN